MRKYLITGFALVLLMGGAWFFFWPFPLCWGQVTTSLAGRSPNQLHNLERAVSLLNRTAVLPGKTFSFNQIAGPYQIENGYLPDKGFLGGRLVDSPGGGVCQLSSTLYYLLIRNGFQCQRAAHGKAILSVPMGFDATVSDQSADLQFTNHTGRPVQIQASIKGGRLFVGLYGSYPAVAQVPVKTQTRMLGQNQYAVWVWAGRELISHDIYEKGEER